MIKNIIIFALLLGFSFIMYQFSTSESDVVRGKRRPGGGYYFIYSGNRIWLNRSFREGSMSGSFRGGGPRAGK